MADLACHRLCGPPCPSLSRILSQILSDHIAVNDLERQPKNPSLDRLASTVAPCQNYQN